MTQSELSFGPREITRRIGNKERLREVLSDGQWHYNTALSDKAGIRYGARVLELRREGLVIHSVSVGDGLWRFRLDPLRASHPKCVGPCCRGVGP